MRSLWLYLGGLLVALVAINVLLVRTIRAERRRESERRRDQARPERRDTRPERRETRH